MVSARLVPDWGGGLSGWGTDASVPDGLTLAYAYQQGGAHTWTHWMTSSPAQNRPTHNAPGSGPRWPANTKPSGNDSHT
ncbi:MAG: hypothetical protein ACR2P2_09640 [Nakamurella sp.]